MATGSAQKLVTLPPLSGPIIGTLSANPKGFGFVSPLEPNAHGDLFIPPGETAEGMSGDIVAGKVVRELVRLIAPYLTLCREN